MTGAPRTRSFLKEIQAAKDRAAAREQGVQYIESEPVTGAEPTSDPADQVEVVKTDPPLIQLTPFQERLAGLKAKQAQPEIAAPEPTPVIETDVPDFEDSQLSADEQMLDQIIYGLDIVDCYNRWSGKKTVPSTTKREGIMCSCPNPAHPDRRPSAWMNRDKGTWYCPGCDEGGDLWDIAAWHFGYPVPHYKNDKALFRQLRDSIATDLGYAKYTTAGKVSYSKTPELVSAEEVAAGAQTNVVQLHAVPDLPIEPDEEKEGPKLKIASLDWRKVVVRDTFLDLWMRETIQDTCPEEFHFFTGLMAIGFAVGRNRVLADIPEVVPNLNICLVGRSGTGKSRAKRHLKELLHLALPFDESVTFPTGTKIMNPGSGEAWLKEFRHEIEDPSNPTGPKKLWPVRGYVEFDEMASLVAKAGRAGSSLKPLLMELYDAPRSLGNNTITGGRVEALEPFGQVMTTTQDRSVRNVFNSSDDAAGFVNRWTFVTGTAKPAVSINTAVLDLTAAATALKDIHHWASKKGALTFTQSAFKLFDDFIIQRVIPARDKSEEFSDIFNRMDLLLKKILILLACNEKMMVIDDFVVQKMITFYPYLIEVYGIIDTYIAETVAGELAELVADVINKFSAKKGAFPTAREIRQMLPPSKRDFEALNKTLRIMIELGLLGKEETQGKRGPKTVRYGIAV